MLPLVEWVPQPGIIKLTCPEHLDKIILQNQRHIVEKYGLKGDNRFGRTSIASNTPVLSSAYHVLINGKMQLDCCATIVFILLRKVVSAKHLSKPFL